MSANIVSQNNPKSKIAITICTDGINNTLSPLAFKDSFALWWFAQEKTKGVSKPKEIQVSSRDIAAFMRDGIFITQS